MIKFLLFFILAAFSHGVEFQSQSVKISDETTSKNTVWSSAKIEAVIATGTTSASLNDLTDVDVSNPEDGQLLGYVDADQVWEATSNASLVSLTADYIDFSTGSSPDCTYGRVYFDGDGTMSVCMETDGVIQQVGMEQYYYVRNNSGSLIGDGDAVMFTGTLGSSGKITVASARADDYFYARLAVGVATQDIPNNSDGFVTFAGAVKGVQTNGADVGETWNDGDIIYVNPSSAGKLTVTTPEPPNARIVMGVVVYAHPTQGVLGIRVKEQGLLDDSHDFYQMGALSGDTIRRDSTNQYWENTGALRVVGSSTFMGSSTSYAKFDEHGFLELKGSARAFDDLRFPALTLRLGATRAPTLKQLTDDGAGSTGVYTYCYDSATEEQQYLAIQFPHSMDFATGFYQPHIHTTPDPGNPGDGTEKAVFGIEYTIANIDSAFSTTTTTYTTITISTTNLQHQYTEFATVPATGLTSSSMLQARIFRCVDCAEDNYPHDTCLLEVDYHIPKNGFGQKIPEGF